MSHKAFVSSTFIDLQAHRAYAIAALRKAGIAVDPMEDWTASSSEPKAFSRGRLEGCDLCVLLVAFRRGHVPVGEHRSITQIEYDEAQTLAVDTLVFMLNEEAPWPRKHDELDKDPEVRRWRKYLCEHHGVSFFSLPPESMELQPAISRWLAEASITLDPKLVIQTIDFKYAQPNRKNRMLLFNGHTAPVFVERLWLMNDEGRHFGPTFMINEIVNENSIKEIVSPPFRNDDTAGESWGFPNDYRAGVIQSLDTNWARLESGWEDEKWENGDPVFVKARVSYKFGEKRLISSAVVWQGFSHAVWNVTGDNLSLHAGRSELATDADPVSEGCYASCVAKREREFTVSDLPKSTTLILALYAPTSPSPCTRTALSRDGPRQRRAQDIS